MSTTGRYRDWFITQMNHTPAEVEVARGYIPSVKYMMLGFEKAPTTGTPHFHLYISFKNARTFSSIKKALPRANIQVRFGTIDQAREYPRKTPDCVFEEYGTVPLSDSDKGQVEKDSWDNYFRLAKENKLEEIPAKVYIRYKRSFDEIRNEYRYKVPRTGIITDLRSWQQHLVASLEVDPNDRTVIWYVDSKGGCGKSQMSKYLVAHKQALLLGPASFVDMAYLLEPAPVVVVDIPREYNLDYFPYSFLEKIKDGCVTSTKYQPLNKIIPKCHVVVFSNFRPNRQRLSEDRWDIRIIENADSSQEYLVTTASQESSSVQNDHVPQVPGPVLQASQAAQHDDS